MSYFKKFVTFYDEDFTSEHQNSANVFLQILGTIGSDAFVIWAAVSSLWWLIILYPVVHALPGLIGHRLFEKNTELGNVRINRTDFPLWWFIIANHILTFRVATKVFTGKAIGR